MTMPPLVAAVFLAFARDLRLPVGCHLALQARPEVLAGSFDLRFDVPLDGALGDPQRLGDGLGALELLDQVPHLVAGSLRDGG